MKDNRALWIGGAALGAAALVGVLVIATQAKATTPQPGPQPQPGPVTPPAPPPPQPPVTPPVTPPQITQQTFTQGHRYSITLFAPVTPLVPLNVSQVQAMMNLVASGLFNVSNITNMANITTATVDIIGPTTTLPTVAIPGYQVAVADLGLTPSS